MIERDYGPGQALELLLGKTAEADELLHQIVRSAINKGKDTFEYQEARGKRKRRRYRRVAPLTPWEALQVAVRVIESYFVEQPLITNAICDEFIKAEVGLPSDLVVPEDAEPWASKGGAGSEKRVDIELSSDTQVFGSEDLRPLRRIEVDDIAEQRENFVKLRDLLPPEPEVRNADAR
jgi:hypothetical protein